MQLDIITVLPERTHRLVPLLFVHGAWHGAWCWRENFMPYFAKNGYMSYAVSLRGHGKSENDRALRWVGVWDYVADINQVAEYIAAQVGVRPVVIGHSMGGYVVQKYLEKHDAPGAALLASFPPGGILAFNLRYGIRRPIVMLKVLLQLSSWPMIGTPKLAQEAFFSADVPKDKLMTYFNWLQDESVRIPFDASLFHRARPEQVRSKQIPIMVMGAADDAIVSVREVEATARAYQTQAVIIPDIAHDVMLEANWQKAADRVLVWLAESRL